MMSSETDSHKHRRLLTAPLRWTYKLKYVSQGGGTTTGLAPRPEVIFGARVRDHSKGAERGRKVLVFTAQSKLSVSFSFHPSSLSPFLPSILPFPPSSPSKITPCAPFPSFRFAFPG